MYSLSVGHTRLLNSHLITLRSYHIWDTTYRHSAEGGDLREAPVHVPLLAIPQTGLIAGLYITGILSPGSLLTLTINCILYLDSKFAVRQFRCFVEHELYRYTKCSSPSKRQVSYYLVKFQKVTLDLSIRCCENVVLSLLFKRFGNILNSKNVSLSGVQLLIPKNSSGTLG